MRGKVAAILLMGVVGGCVNPPPTPITSVVPYTLSQEDMAAVKAGVQGSLKDPNSALFGERMVAARANDFQFITVCGTVNAKNSFGGYTGNKPFMGRLLPSSFPGSGGTTRFVVEAMGGQDFENQLTRSKCSKFQLYI